MTGFGRYEVVDEIGRGAMGAVFKANDPVMERVVAIKTILAAALAGPQAEEYRERFKREARAAGRLSHPGVVTVYDVGVQEGTPYLVMEFVPSRTLESALDSGERFTIERTMEIGQQLASALDYAHKNGVIHRDIKPANILLTATTPERAKITDFGVAKLSAAQATSTGALLGTPAFMAPEQFTGLGVDGRSDLFSLGVVLYWMATGDKPFGGDTITAVSYKIVHTEPIPPRTLNRAISPAFESVLLKCLAKDPNERYQSGEQLAQDLANLREGRTTASQISAMRTVAVAPPAADPQATVAIHSTGGAAAPLETQETIAIGSTPKPGAIPSPQGSTVAPPEVRVQMSPPIRPVATAPPAPAPQASPAPIPPRTPPPPPAATPAPARVAPRLQPPPQPQAANSRGWLIGLAVLVVLGLLWGANFAKKKKEEAAAAAQAAQQAAATKPAPPLETTEAAKPETLTSPSEPPKKTEEKAAATPPSKPKIEKPKAEPAEEPAADIGNYALRLEIYAVAPTTVQILPDDRPAESFLLKVGRKVQIGADKVFQLRTDNAGALRLTLNDQQLAELGPMGAPRTVRLTARDLKPAASPAPAAANPVGASQAAKTSAATAKSASATQTAPAATGPATLEITVPNMPNFADIVIWMDDKPIFRQQSSSQGGFAPLQAQRKIPPGTHEFRVYMGKIAVKTGIQKRISGDFASGQSQTLRIDTRWRGMPHDVTNLGFMLSLE